MNGPLSRSGNAQNSANGGRFDNWVECLIIVNIGSLTFSISNQSSFVPGKRTICLVFLLKQPHVMYNISPLGPWDKFPCFFRNKSIKLVLHGNGSVRVTKSMDVRLRHKRLGDGVEVGTRHGFVDATFCMCHHRKTWQRLRRRNRKERFRYNGKGIGRS